MQLCEQTSKNYTVLGSHVTYPLLQSPDQSQWFCEGPLVLLGELVSEGVADGAAGSCLLWALPFVMD